MKNDISYVDIILPFLKKAGKIALESQGSIVGHSKPDGSVVTDTDLKISNMFQKFIKKNFKGHCVLDEEKALKEKNLREKVYNTEYLWIIDPIDGTKTYFNGSDLYATALSLYKDQKPIFGLIYIPSKAEIIYNDNNKVYRILNAFKKNQIKIENLFIEKEVNKNSFVSISVKDVAEHIKDYSLVSFFDPYCSYIHYNYLFTNASIGVFTKPNISMWDIYSALPIANALGIKFYNVNNGSTLEKVDFDLFDNKLMVKNIWLICHSVYKNKLLSVYK